jgi:Rieske Fe-S protein
MPGAFEGETVTRRRVMTGVAHGAGGVAAAAFTLPALGFALAPIFKHEAWSWQTVGPVSDFPSTQDFVTRILDVQKDAGESGNTLVYMRKRIHGVDTEQEDQYNRIIAISSRCMHVGCPVRWTSAAERFICPCHGGVYNVRGIVTGGPPVRPLDRFYTRITSDGLVQIGPRYSVNSELQRFSPRLPGEPLDGIGQFLYPAQFAGPKKP